MTRERQLFAWYTKQLGVHVGDDVQRVIIVPNESCHGCREVVANYSLERHRSEIIFVSNRIASWFNDCPVLIDTLAICDNLNWDYTNIIEVFVCHGVCDSVKDYDADETIRRFRGNNQVR